MLKRVPLSLKQAGLLKVFSSLQSRNYRLYFAGQSISLIGSWMQSVAISWLVYRLTGSVFLLGLIGFTNQIPAFVLSPFSGVLTDRFDRRRIMLVVQAGYMFQAMILTILVMTNTILVWQLVTLSLIFGILSAFDAPARHSLVIDLLDNPEHLGNAIALNSAIFNGARLIGPAIAGIIIAMAGEGICFLLNALSYLAVIYALLKMSIPAKPARPVESDFRKSFSDGFTYTFSSLPIRRLLIQLAILSLVAFPFMVLMPAYVKEILKADADTLGFLVSAMGAGALTGAIYLAARKTVLGLGRIISRCSALLGITLILVSVSANTAFSMGIFYFAGLSMIMSVAAINTMIQTIADEDKRGRVMSFYTVALIGTTPIGNLMAGSIASGIGLPHTLLAGGIVTILSGVWFEMNRKSLRQHIRPIYIRKGILSEVPVEV